MYCKRFACCKAKGAAYGCCIAYNTAKDEMLAVTSDSRPTPVFDELYRLVTEINDVRWRRLLCVIFGNWKILITNNIFPDSSLTTNCRSLG